VVYHIFLSVFVGIDLDESMVVPAPQRTVRRPRRFRKNADLLNLRRSAGG
jgi:hypothetical protein